MNRYVAYFPGKVRAEAMGELCVKLPAKARATADLNSASNEGSAEDACVKMSAALWTLSFQKPQNYNR